MIDATRLLADGFAEHVARWARRLGCDEGTVRALRGAAAQASVATSQGHVCVQLADTSARDLLLGSGLVGSPAQPGSCPLVLDAANRLYLQRQFDDERRLARRLVRARDAPVGRVDASARAMLHTLFAAGAARDTVDWQMLAAALAVRNRLLIISGGPGTGKTTTVVAVLACLLAQDPAARIALAAPTGKARARLVEAIAQRAAIVPAAVRGLLPASASTVHRLLGARADGSFAHHAGNPLPIDVLVVDEASMLDLAMARHLLEAVPDAARIILLGDRNQLAAVESGAVFSELSADHALDPGVRLELAAACGIDPARIDVPAGGGALRDSVVWLRDSHRFSAGSALGRLAADIAAGQCAAVLRALREAADDGVRWIDDAAPGIVAGYRSYLEAVRRGPRDPTAVMAAFNRFRVLCALREGPRGVAAINELLARQARALAGGDPKATWYPGRPVIVMRNDYTLDLMNGDVGIALPDGSGALQVHFAAGDGTCRAMAPARLPAHETAFATTVHKAQGSEYDEVLVVLPDEALPVVTRELLYTAVTRARVRAAISAGEAVLRAAIESPTRRDSGLLARLAEQAGRGESAILGGR